ncbi:hypothetical protein T12_5796 [Trichinella patagoniensis]|uniref:Uncharacterized protein n=1 Tax=Trichinella patagoniensis TaxID=990121 RepID=A0A0V0ZRI3_9BILA|nr:hypothetical protein T12_5796 [Trichinella patagoniensis]
MIVCFFFNKAKLNRILLLILQPLAMAKKSTLSFNHYILHCRNIVQILADQMRMEIFHQICQIDYWKLITQQNCEAVVLELFSNIEQPPVGSAQSSNKLTTNFQETVESFFMQYIIVQGIFCIPSLHLLDSFKK